MKLVLKHLKSKQDWTEKSLGAKGFTLIELLVVIVILGILAAVVVFAVGGIADKGQGSACKAEANTVRTAAEAYATSDSTGNYAADATVLKTAKFLSNAPTYVTYTGSGSAFTIAWAGKCVAWAAANGNPTP
jgi:general secretion pathway protein G